MSPLKKNSSIIYLSLGFNYELWNATPLIIIFYNILS